MDAASGLAVSCLGILSLPYTGPKRVLDLCCCPGAKFQMIASQLAGTDDCGDSLVVGVDFSPKRIEVCKSLLDKAFQYQTAKETEIEKSSQQTPRQLIFYADGTSFDGAREHRGELRFDSVITLNDIRHRGERRKTNKSSIGREKRQLLKVFGSDNACDEDGGIDQRVSTSSSSSSGEFSRAAKGRERCIRMKARRLSGRRQERRRTSNERVPPFHA